MTHPKPDGYDPGRIGGTPDEIAEAVGSVQDDLAPILDDLRARQAETTANAEAARNALGRTECESAGAEHAPGMPNTPSPSTDLDPTVMANLKPGVRITYTEAGDGPSVRGGTHGSDEQFIHTYIVNGDPVVEGDDWWVPVDVRDRAKTVYVGRNNIISATRA